MGLRIIIADDDRDTVWTLATILRDEGHSVQGVHRGEDVLRAASFLKPDVALIDLQMPGVSGYAVAQELRNLFYPMPAPLLIAISGIWTKGCDRLLAQHIGFDHHLEKPCDAAELLRLLAPLAGRAARTR
ncbi:MAG TPA: response regulator [Burkholderiales bacterium]|nr:response regulator [Burkholderiales bacterium]